MSLSFHLSYRISYHISFVRQNNPTKVGCAALSDLLPCLIGGATPLTHGEGEDHEIQSGRMFSADGCALPGYVEYEADELCDIFREMSVEEAAMKYAITLVDGGKYADHEGDIGDVISEYKNRDIDGDGRTDVIRREGYHYIIEFSDGEMYKYDRFDLPVIIPTFVGCGAV